MWMKDIADWRGNHDRRRSQDEMVSLMARDPAFQLKLEEQAIERLAMSICEGIARMEENRGWVGVHWIKGGIRYALKAGLMRLPEELNT
jgi:hypothetical protein